MRNPRTHARTHTQGHTNLVYNQYTADIRHAVHICTRQCTRCSTYVHAHVYMRTRRALCLYAHSLRLFCCAPGRVPEPYSTAPTRVFHVSCSHTCVCVCVSVFVCLRAMQIALHHRSHARRGRESPSIHMDLGAPPI